MDTLSRQASEEEVIQSRMFNLNRGFSGTFQRPSLFLEPQFPWLVSDSALSSRTAWVGCPTLSPIEAIVDGDSPLITIEDFDGISLASRLEQQTPAATEAFSLLAQLAAAVDHLHTSNRVHGALSPISILIAEDGSLRIVDWMVDWNRVPLRFLSEVSGYLSPERLANGPAGPSADRFAFGVLAYQLLVGRVPFPGEGLAERLFRLRYGLFDDGVFAETDLANRSVFERVFSTDPVQRFDSCSVFLHELEKSQSQRSYAETRLLKVKEPSLASPDAIKAVELADTPPPRANYAPLTGWWITSAVFALLAFVLGISNWQMQGQIDKAADLTEQLRMNAAVTGSLQNGKFQVCNASPDALNIRELAVAYWDRNHKLRVFSSTAYTQEGWVVASASSQFFTWLQGQKTVWDGSVLLYFVRVIRGEREYVVSGRWDGSAQGCLHLSS